MSQVSRKRDLRPREKNQVRPEAKINKNRGE